MPRSVHLVACALTLLTSTGCASTRAIECHGPQRQAVLAALQTYFDAMQARDVQASEQVLVPEGVFVSVRPVAGKQTLRSSTNATYLADLRAGGDRLHETMQDPVVLVDGDVAVVWTDYRFERNGVPAHTGKDAFTLVHIDGTWKIAGGAYTVIPTAASGR